MTNSTRGIIFLILAILSPVVAESSEYMLFAPVPSQGEPLLPERGKGVLVKRITIKPGDTLSQISRDYNGRGSFFPQILLFNDISNPDLILAGKELIVPIVKLVTASKAATQEKIASQPVKKRSFTQPKQSGVTAAIADIPSERNQRKSNSKLTLQKQVPVEQPGNRDEQDSFSTAISAYRKGEYKKSLSLFSLFLEKYPSSLMAADASLYKAESLFKLSGQ